MKTLLAAALMAGIAAAQEQDPAARIRELVQQLGADEYAAREKATEELRKIGKPAEDALKKALESQDPEVRTRAKGILEAMSKPARPTEPEPRAGRPGRPGFGFRGSSIQVQSTNGESVYTITPGDGSDPITFHKAAAGRVKLQYPDGKGGTASAESESIEKFLADHKELAAKYGITQDGIDYAGARTSFKGGFGLGGRALDLPLPRAFKLENLFEEGPERFGAAGATFELVSDVLRAQFEIPEGQGLAAVRVPETSDAYAAGLRKSDLLLEVDGRKISTAAQVKELLKKSSALGVVRKGRRETVRGSDLPKKDF